MKSAVEAIYLTMILKAPRGVTRTAGANAYATQFAISPTITIFRNQKTTHILHTISQYPNIHIVVKTNLNKK